MTPVEPPLFRGAFVVVCHPGTPGLHDTVVVSAFGLHPNGNRYRFPGAGCHAPQHRGVVQTGGRGVE